ncbi:MAG: hypothetical protein NT118_15780, partial [Lentisphaerae bacterium]|nr:hypothetical protein [Lentisphaerota bacterium]
DLPVIMYRDVWKEISTTPPTGYYTATLPGNGEYGSGYLALTVDAAGKVKTAGKLADGTVVSLGGTLILDETEPGRVFAVIYASPAAYKDSCLFGLAEFVKGDGHVFVRLLDGVPFLWENYNPLSTQDYPSNGFARDLGLSGGLYDNMIDLQTYYANGLTVGGINPPPSLFVAVKYTDFDPESEAEKPPKKTTTVIEEVPDAGVSPDGLVLAGLAAPKADTPKKVIDPDTKEFFGEYNYADLNNPTGLTISFTQATGIFKGSFNAYYDYISADNYTLEEPHPTWSHVVRKASYEGVLTPGRENTADGIEGRGFYLWPGKSTYEKLDKEWNPVLDKNGDPVLISYSFDWSYDFILQSGE